MILGRLGEEVKEEFSVLDSSNNLVSGIPLNEFTGNLFDPSDNEVYDSTSVTFIELGHGHYRVTFTPNQVGNWMMIAYHNTHFPWGKTNTIQVFANDFESIATMLQKVLGLVQENFYLDNIVYDESGNMTTSRIRIYSDSSSVGTNNNIIESYNITAAYNTNNQLTEYQVKN